MTTENVDLVEIEETAHPTLFGEGLRRFSDSRIQETIDRVLGQIPDGSKGAVVAFADRSGARLATMARLDEHWSVVMVGERKWSGELEAEAAVRFVW